MSHEEIPRGEITPDRNTPSTRGDDALVHTPRLLENVPADVGAKAAELMGTRRALDAIMQVAERDEPKAANILAAMSPGEFRALIKALPENAGGLLGSVAPAAFAEQLKGLSSRKVEKYLQATESGHAEAVRGAIQAKMEEMHARMELVHLAKEMGGKDPALSAILFTIRPELADRAPKIFSEMKPGQAASILGEMAKNGSDGRQRAIDIVRSMEQDAIVKMVEAKPETFALIYRDIEAGLQAAREVVPGRVAEKGTVERAPLFAPATILEKLAGRNPKQAARMLEELRELAAESLGNIRTSEAAAIVGAGKPEKLAPVLTELAEHNPHALAAILQEAPTKKGADVARRMEADKLYPVLEAMQGTEKGSLKVAELIAEMAKIEEWKSAKLWSKMKVAWMDNKVTASLVAASTALSSSIDVTQIAVSDHGIANLPFLASALTASVTSLTVGRFGYEQMQKRTIPHQVPILGGKKLTDSTSLFQISFSVAWGVVSGAMQLIFNYLFL